MRPIASASLLLRTALLGGLVVAALASTVPARAEVGVASAVNVDARGRPPGGAPRVISLGSNVVFKEEITTDAAGLVQILLLDGTTFTVGPNSQLTIDEFVYNPDTGDAKVVASLTKGVFRFVGARTSQTEGGATVKTPVGTIGIRGGVANFSCDAGECKASLVAGKSLTIVDSNGTERVVYETGYTAVISKGPGGGTTTTVRKATAAETKAFQRQLASKPGQSGGASSSPDDNTVEQSPVGEVNSGRYPDTMQVPGSNNPGQPSEVDQVINDKAQEDINDDIASQEEQGNTRVLTAPGVYNAFFGTSFEDNGGRGLVGSTDPNDEALDLGIDGGRLVNADGSLDLPDYSGSQGDEGLESIDIGPGGSCYPDECDEAFYQGNSLGGTAYAGAGDFVAYMLGYNGDPTQPVYIIHGTPTPEGVLTATLETGFNLRRYTLTDDPIQNIPVPFFNNDLYGGNFESGSYNSSDLFVIEPGDSSTGDTLTFQSWVSIEGTGASQRSAAFLNTSNVYRNADDVLVMDGGRRGSFRDNVTGEATNMRGGISTIAGGQGNHFFGPNADHFVIGTDASINRPDTFFDSHNGPGFSSPSATGYLNDGNFATHHVASLMDDTEPTGRSYGLTGPEQLQGFMAGMGESSVGGSDDPYRLTGNDLTVTFNAVDNAFAAQGTVHDVYDDDDVVQSMLLTFGRNGATFGQSAYINDTYYGALNNDVPANSQLVDDNNTLVAQTPDQAAGSYIVSGRANPIEGYEHLPNCSECDFIQWGWWGTRLATGPENAGREDYVHMGTWVAGDVSTEAEIETIAGLPAFSGEVSYEGTVMATVVRDTDPGVAVNNTNYIATGNLLIDYDFGSRTGTVNIDQFDVGSVGPGGISLDGAIGESDSMQSQLFSGTLSGSNLYTMGDPDNGDDPLNNDMLYGNLSGAFVNSSVTPPDGGPNVAAGLVGSFDFAGPNLEVGVGADVKASGTIAGIRQLPIDP